MQNLNSGYNARDAWAAFNGLYQRAARPSTDPDRPSLSKREKKREQKQLRTRIHDDWERIRTDHPDNHVELKLELGNAIRRTTAANRSVERDLSTVRAQRATGFIGPVEIYEDVIAARVRALAALKDLAEVEQRVGMAADFIWAHGEREIATLKRVIRIEGDYMAILRRGQEGDPIGTTHRRHVFQSSSLPAPPAGHRQWHGYLAHGDLSLIGFCLTGDQHNRIVDRFAMKDMWFTNHPNLWTDVGFWMGDPRDPTAKVPREVHIMGRLTATEQQNILRMRSWHMAPEKLMYRIYMEYCPNGDGMHLLEHYRRQNVNNQQQNSQQPNSYIPEPAIWHIFNSLIKADLTMERVFVNDGDQVNAKNLSEVVHLDFKPDNIFLGDYPPDDPDVAPNNFAMYPTIKLGDFGLATYRRLAENSPNVYFGRGTPGYFPPEQMLHYHGRQPRPHLNAKTNVWGVGITLMTLMNLNAPATNQQFQRAATNELDPLLVPDFTPAAIAGYSAKLRELVRACVQYRQDDRPSFASLLASLRYWTVPTPGLRDYALGARFATKTALPPGLTLLSGLPANNYALGMAMPA